MSGRARMTYSKIAGGADTKFDYPVYGKMPFNITVKGEYQFIS